MRNTEPGRTGAVRPLWSEAENLRERIAQAHGLFAFFSFDAALAQTTDLAPVDRAQVADAFRELAPHPDVEPALRQLAEAGVRAVTLSHGSPGVAEAGLERGGIAPLVERTLTSESVRAWKPNREVYLWAAGVCDVEP